MTLEGHLGLGFKLLSLTAAYVECGDFFNAKNDLWYRRVFWEP